MRLFKRCLLATALTVTAGFSSFALADDSFPKRDINAVIQWGPGGLTDVVMRRLAPLAEEELGRKIISTNRAGGSGVVGANYVLQQPADGYTLLTAAEVQSLYRLNGLADFDFDRFTPINVIMTSDSVLLVANKDFPANTFQELLDYAEANPGKIKQYTPGLGTTGYTANAMLNTQVDFKTTLVPYDGDGPALAAVQGGHIDIALMGANGAYDHIKAGRVKALGVLNTEEFEGIEPLTDTLPGLEKYLPWGSWIGVFVRKETPEPVKEKLISAFKKAAETPEYKEFITSSGGRLLNYSGAEAEAFISDWQSKTGWLYEEIGAAKVSPEKLGFPKPAYYE